MVAVIVSLKLTLLRNGLRRSTFRTIGLIIGMVYGLAAVVAAWIGMIMLRSAPTWLAADLTVIGFALLAIGWPLMSLLVFGTDLTVDPARFALLPVSARRLQPGLLIAGLLGTPGIASLLIAFGLVAVWSRGVGQMLAALVAVPLGLATFILLARTATSAFARALASRRFGDFAAVALSLFGGGLGLTIVLVTQLTSASTGGAIRPLLDQVAAVMGWTPFGWIWSFPAEISRGQLALAGVKLALGAGLAAGLWFGWRSFLERSLTSPLESSGPAGKVASGGIVDRIFPHTVAGAVAGRSLRYWRRDPRYLSVISSLCIAPIVIIAIQLIVGGYGSTTLAAFAPVLIALTLGSITGSNISFDGSALWTHITASVSGPADRAGRAMAAAVAIGPIAVLMALVAGLVSRRLELLPEVLVLLISLGLIGLGIGSWTGSVWQVPVAPPGANPFQGGEGGGLATLTSTVVSVALTTAIGAPVIALIVASFSVSWLLYVAIVVGVAIGSITLRIGIRRGGARLDRGWPEVLARVGTTS